MKFLVKLVYFSPVRLDVITYTLNNGMDFESNKVCKSLTMFEIFFLFIFVSIQRTKMAPKGTALIFTQCYSLTRF